MLRQQADQFVETGLPLAQDRQRVVGDRVDLQESDVAGVKGIEAPVGLEKLDGEIAVSAPVGRRRSLARTGMEMMDVVDASAVAAMTKNGQSAGS
jgi:hypothetical protein